MKLYLLWEEILDVDNSPTLHGVFDSLKTLQAHIEGRYFEFRLRHPMEFDFGEPEVRISIGSGSCLAHVWCEVRQLNEPDQNYIVDGEVVIRGDPHNKASPQ